MESRLIGHGQGRGKGGKGVQSRVGRPFPSAPLQSLGPFLALPAPGLKEFA